MKNILFLLFIFSLISCADDDFLRSDLERQRNNQIIETGYANKNSSIS